MKVEELMINDWVSINDSNFQVKVIKKKGVIKLYDNTEWGEHEIDFNTDYLEEFLQPIPLTEEILEKNGFEKDIDYGYFIGQSNSGYYIYFNNNHLSIQAGYDAIEFAWCEYVHELQHALKLCGIIKSIKLRKHF